MSRRRQRREVRRLREVVSDELRSTRSETLNENPAIGALLSTAWKGIGKAGQSIVLGTLTTTIASALGKIFSDEADRALAQAIQADPRMADAAALYAAMKKRFGVDEVTVNAVLLKNAHDLPGLADRYSKAAAVITGGNIGSVELISDLQAEGMKDHAKKIGDAFTARQSAATQTPAAGLEMPPMPPMPQMQHVPPGPSAIGQPVPTMSEARVRRAIRRELLKIL